MFETGTLSGEGEPSHRRDDSLKQHDRDRKECGIEEYAAIDPPKALGVIAPRKGMGKPGRWVEEDFVIPFERRVQHPVKRKDAEQRTNDQGSENHCFVEDPPGCDLVHE